MSFTAWDHFADSPDEFLVPVEIFISNTASTTLRKPPNKSKKNRESAGEDLKIKEKTSSNWLSAQKNLSAAGYWRSASCRLTGEGGRSFMNIYVDESILYQTVYIHLLHQTDIRPTETSLFGRRDSCLAIFSRSAQRWTTSNSAEPLYLSFSNSETCSSWQALLKSYAIPEIYGRWFSSSDGGSYRMWRQVELTVIQGRNLNNLKADAGGSKDESKDEDGSDVDISCEIYLNGVLCSRTTAKRGFGSLDWHETFAFPGLPPFENLDIVVWRERKFFKPNSLGTTCIALGNFRRGDPVEGWFPVVQPGAIGSEFRVGDLRLKIRVDEEIILPYSSYSGLMATFKSRNFLDWVSDLESRLKLKNIATNLKLIAIANNTIVEHVQEYASREIEDSATSNQTLFRGNTTLTKAVEFCMTWYGKSFLEASIGAVLRRLCWEKVAIEVDPVRSGKSAKDTEKNVEQLIYWCREFWNQIHSAKVECPNEMRSIFKKIRELVERRYRRNPESVDDNLPRQSVSAFIFLRFIVPAILHPHLFGLYPGLLPLPVQRSLTLIAKVMQSLANLNISVQKQSFMGGVEDFLKNNHQSMIDYIVTVSTPLSDGVTSNGGDARNRHYRLQIANALRRRTKVMTSLERESVPMLPHLIDIPKQLAIITSAVVRNSRELIGQPRTSDDVEIAVDEFCSKCFEVEEDALSRASQLVSKLIENDSKRTSSEDLSVKAGDDIPNASNPLTSIAVSKAQSCKRGNSRPSTAPCPMNSDLRQSGQSSYNVENVHASPRINALPDTLMQRQWNDHVKAPSTDSLPRIVPDVSNIVRLEKEEGSGRRKKGLLKGILRR